MTGEAAFLEVYLATMFRPVDSHCIHIDVRANDLIRGAVTGVVRCYKEQFPDANLFISSTAVPAFDCDGSGLEANLICLRELSLRDSKWQFYLNPSESSLPLLSHRDLRKWLKKEKRHSFVDLGTNERSDNQRHFRTMESYVVTDTN